MAYTPIVVTEENISTAINENIELIRAELANKVGSQLANQLLADMDLGGLKAVNAGNPTTSRSAVTKLYLDVLIASA